MRCLVNVLHYMAIQVDLLPREESRQTRAHKSFYIVDHRKWRFQQKILFRKSQPDTRQDCHESWQTSMMAQLCRTYLALKWLLLQKMVRGRLYPGCY